MAQDGEIRQHPNGGTYRRENGAWVLQGGGAPAQPQSMTIGTPDPSIPLDMEYKRGQIAAQGRTAATAPYDARRAAADADKAEAEAAKAKLALKDAGDPLVAQAQQQLSQDEVLSAIAMARQEIGKGWATGLPGQALSYVGGTNARDLSGSISTIASALTLDKLKALKDASPTGASGLGSLTEKEGALLRDSVASLDQAQSTDKLLDGLAKVDRHYRRIRALVAGQNPDDEKVAQQYGLMPNPPTNGGASGPGGGNTPPPDWSLLGSNGPAPTGSPTAEGKMVSDPALRGVNARVAAMIRDGQNAGQVRSYLDSVQPGLGGRTKGIEAWVTHHGQHPTANIAVDVERSWQPSSGTSRILGEAGMSAPGAFVINAADALTAGTMDNWTGDPAMTRAAMGGVADAHPVAATLGGFAGNIAGTAGTGMALGALGKGGKLLSNPVVADALYGSAYGAGSADEGSRVMGGLTGGTLNVIGSKLGEKAFSAAGSVASGVTDDAVQYLHNQGVRMTPGQMLGGTAKRAEDRLSGFGGLGDRITALRSRGIDDFNLATGKQAYERIGFTPKTVGEVGTEAASNAISGAYDDALGGVTSYADQPFMAGLAGVKANGQKIPGELAGEIDNTLNARVAPFIDPQSGEITGKNFQAIQRGVRQDMGDLSTKSRYDLYRDEAAKIEDLLRGLVDRQNPGVVGKLDDANSAYRGHKILEDAVIAARNTGGRYTPAQLGNSVITNTKKFGGKAQAASTERPFFDIQRHGQDVLPSKIPDSGTAGRAREGGFTSRLLGAAGDMAKAPLYSDALEPIIRAGLLDRPDEMIALGKKMKEYSRVGGIFGGAGMLQYVGGQ